MGSMLLAWESGLREGPRKYLESLVSPVERFTPKLSVFQEIGTQLP